MNLKTLREEAGISRIKVAKLISRKIHTLEKYETSHRLPSTDILIKLADIYEVDYNTIITAYKYHKEINDHINNGKKGSL